MMFTKNNVMAVISVFVFFMIASYILHNILCSIYEDLKKKFDKDNKWPSTEHAILIVLVIVLIILCSVVCTIL